MKILLILLSAFSFLFAPKTKNDITVETEVTSEIVTSNIKIEENEVTFYYKGIELKNFKTSNYDISRWQYFVKSEHFFLFSYDGGYISVYEWDSTYKLVSNTVLDIKVSENYKVLLVDDQFYIMGGDAENSEERLADNNIITKDYLEKENCYIIALTPTNSIAKGYIFGGAENEYVEDGLFLNDYFYLIVKKDRLTKGDLGDGGENDSNYMLVKIDKDGDIQNYITFKEQNYCDLNSWEKGTEGGISVAFISKIYTLSYDLDGDNCLQLPTQSIFASLSITKTYLSLDRENLIIGDYITNDIFEKIPIKAVNYLNLLVLEDNFYIIEDDVITKYEIYDTRDFIDECNYEYNIDTLNKTVTGWYKIYEIQSWDSSPKFMGNINGTYSITFDYGVEKLISTVTVLEKCNVNSGLIYPLGYKLYFTGMAYLNDKPIYNNYTLTEAGEYSLSLTSASKEIRIIEFSVSSDQYKFQTEIIGDTDLEVHCNESYSIKYDVTSDVVGVSVDNTEYSDFSYSDNLLTINFLENKSGVVAHTVDSITCQTGETTYMSEVGDKITVKVLKEVPTFSMEVTEDKKNLMFSYDVTDTDATIRYFREVIDGCEYSTEPVSSYTIKLNEDSTNKNLIQIMMGYDTGCGDISEKQVLELVYSGKNASIIGDVNITSKETKLNSFEININKTSVLKAVNLENNLVYSYTKPNYIKPFGVAIAIIIGSLVLWMGFNKYKKKKNNLKGEN